MMVTLLSVLLLASIAYTAEAAVAQLTVASVGSWPTSSGSTTNMAFDGLSTTSWVSNPCRSGAWRSNSVMNVIQGSCSSGFCSASCDSSLISSTDQNPYTAGTASFNQGEGRSWAVYTFPTGTVKNIESIYVRGSWPVNTTMFGMNGNQLIPLKMLDPSLTYLDVNIPGPFPALTGLKFEAATRDGVMRGFCYAGIGDCKSITITDVAVQISKCYEELSVDFGSLKNISYAKASFSGFVNGSIMTSVDGNNYVNRNSLAQYSSGKAPFTIPMNIFARYVKFRFMTSTLPTRIWDKVYVQDILFYGQDATTLSNCPNKCSNNGICDMSKKTCTCNAGFTGVDCSIATCSPACTQNGICVNGACSCNPGFSGTTCSTTICPFNCWNNGKCIGGACICKKGFSGSDCRYSTYLTMSNGVAKNVTILNYSMILENRTFTNPAAITKFYKKSTTVSRTPFKCSYGPDAISLGQCAIQKNMQDRSANSSAQSLQSLWKSAKYDKAPLVPITVVTTSGSSSAGNVIDGSTDTFWQSGTCYPTGYMLYADLNIFSGVCSRGGCSMSGTGTTIASATDLNTNSAAGPTVVSGSAWFQINFSATKLAAISYRTSATGIKVYGVLSGGSKVYLTTVSASYSVLNLDISSNATLSSYQFSGIRFEYTAGFSLFEVSGRVSPCFEYATVDLGSAKVVSGVTIRHWAGSGTSGQVASTWYEGSQDGTTWVSLTATSLSPQLTNVIDAELAPALSLHYVRVRHVLNELSSTKVMIWEISVWGSSGKYGDSPLARPNPVSFRDLLGVNGIWGWGHNMYSTSIANNSGPSLYSKSMSHARNYHNWIWDVVDPDNIPQFDKMVKPGSTDFGIIPGPHDSKLNQDWLNWDNEYTSWRKAGLEVEASIQFTPSSFPQSVFTNPYMAGYNYGYAFAKHFGTKSGTGDVTSMEVGNEPWIAGMGYSDPAFYRNVLMGMAKGAKDADPTMRVLPAAFGNLSDTLARVNVSHLPYLDGYNVHAYSWLNTPLGRQGIHPEHNMSSLHSVNAFLRFRDRVTPDMPVYLTEWGWDSAGGGEDCNPPAERAGSPPFPECVSETSQALYAIRGALVLARKGFSRLTWYFYGNTVSSVQSWDAAKGVFSRSGLTSSSAAGYKTKKALYALEEFVSILGDSHFLRVIREDRDAYVYVLGDDAGVETHVVAWRPVSADDTSSSSVSFGLDDLAVVKATSIPATNGCSFVANNYAIDDSNVMSISLGGCVIVFDVGVVHTFRPTPSPSATPTVNPTAAPTKQPTVTPSRRPTFVPTLAPTPTPQPSPEPTLQPSAIPSMFPTPPRTRAPTMAPSVVPTVAATRTPTMAPSGAPTVAKTRAPTLAPSGAPTVAKTRAPTLAPSGAPTVAATRPPTLKPTRMPTPVPTPLPTLMPSLLPISLPTLSPTARPTQLPTLPPVQSPSVAPVLSPSVAPVLSPSLAPVLSPSLAPVLSPSLPPVLSPSLAPTPSPTLSPILSPTLSPTLPPTVRVTTPPTPKPTALPSLAPTVAPSFTPTAKPTRAPTQVPLATVRPTRSPTK